MGASSCFWPWDHEWSKWVTLPVDMVDDFTRRVAYTIDKQFRKCEKCGLERVRTWR